MQELNLGQQALEEHWTRFSERLNAINSRLAQELESCWRDVSAILDRQLKQLNGVGPATLVTADLDAFQRERAEAARELLIEPMAQWERRRPYKRAMLAIDSYDRSLAELIRSLPESVLTNGPLTMELLGRHVTTGMARRVAGFRRKQYALSLRATITADAQRLTMQRASIEGRFLMTLAQAIQQIRSDWEVRREALDCVAQGEPSPQREAAARKAEVVNAAGLVRQAESALSDWRDWSAGMTAQFARPLLKGVAWRRKIKSPAAGGQRAACLMHWSEQARSIEDELGFEQSLERSEDTILRLSQSGLDGLAEERGQLLAELDCFIGWLRNRLSGGAQTDVPPPNADVVPASSRMAELETRLEGTWRNLPERVRILTKFSALPRRWAEPKELRPAATAREAFERSGREEMTSTFAEAEASHHHLVRVVEQAREVVAFGLTAEETEQKRDPQIALEALQNAVSLLEFHRNETKESLTDADARFTRALARVFGENRLILSRNRLGAFAYLGQQGAQQGFAIGSRRALEATHRLLRLSLRTLQQAGQSFLIYIGWLPDPSPEVGEVVVRPFLPQEFTADLSTKELPAIYRRLFRFEAVQDPRFLVGRDREMEAIADARAMWEAGRSVAVLIIGERGSGKTSLINCAIKRPLEGLEIVRGEFNERLSNAGQLREFLAKLLGLDDPAQLEQALNKRRRVVVLEELERSFLRQIGHYAAMRDLQRLIAATCGNTLWIVVTNQIAFRFLDASVSIGQSFSHRINAASAARDALRDAILLRHNLSGLRLQFSLLSETRTIVGRLRNRLRGQADPEAIFFDQLARESAGVFRTAFEIWLGQIEAARAGTLLMKPLAAPDLTPVIDALDTDDLFTLVAVLQHGSLMADEHATIFQKSLAASRAQIDELLAREIIEQDPGRPGFRIRPEALRVVKEALYRRNLL